jgi:hypothetical protein
MKKEAETPSDHRVGTRDSNLESATATKLESLLSFWVRERQEPLMAMLLDDDEYLALVIAAKRKFSLQLSPLEVDSFVSLPRWLQRWVMEKSGWDKRKGKRLG